MELVLVINLITGRRWLVPGEGTRPSHSTRKRAGLTGVEVIEGLVACVACGLLVSTVVGLDYLGHAIAPVEFDRVVNNHPDYLVVTLDGRPARVGYCPASVVVTCPACNGSSRRELVRDELREAAAARLDRYAETE